MTEPEPMDAAQRESLEYWNGYYQGKAAAMRNIGVIRRTYLTPRGPRRVRDNAASAVLDAGFFAGGVWLTWPGTLDHPSFWLHVAVGLIYGSWIGHRLSWWRGR